MRTIIRHPDRLRKLAQFVVLIAILAGIYLYDVYVEPNPENQTFDRSTVSVLDQAISNRLSDVQVEGSGRVVKVLPDDTQGSQHQRLLVKLDSGHVVLIAHNIDLAPRIDQISVGDKLSFFGEFEWNDKGGVVHWTHHDPQGRHPDGWLDYEGQKYQ